MEKEKLRKVLPWISVAIFNIGMILGFILGFISTLNWSELNGVELNWSENIFLFILFVGAFLFCSVVPVILSQSNFKYKSRITWGIPLLIVVIILALMSQTAGCRGGFCGLFEGSCTFINLVPLFLFYRKSF